MGAETLDAGRYKGLRRAEATLASQDYFGEPAFQRDLLAIWYRSWLMVCRSADLAEPRAFRLFRIGSQEVLVLRDEAGTLRAFYNTCRHRGSQLCQTESGRLKGRLITCPYHAWSYALDGRLVRAPSKRLPEGFETSDFPLYGVAAAEWRGFVFVNLDEAAEPVETAFDPAAGDLGHWPLEALLPGHVYRKTMACNWKIFWENFNECLHCPGVHRDLSRLVPIYGRGLMARHDDPDWANHADDPAPEFAGTLRGGAESWSVDGKAHAPRFVGLTPEEERAGQTYAVSLPSAFIVGHVDYVRVVRLKPLGPTQTELEAQWLFLPEALAPGAADIDKIVAFSRQVLDEDAAICEVNQRGLASVRHRAGVLMPEEYELLAFHDWVRGKHALAARDAGGA